MISNTKKLISINAKVLTISLAILASFTAITSITISVLSFGSYEQIKRDELKKTSQILSAKINKEKEELFKLTQDLSTNNNFIQAVTELSRLGPFYAVDSKLLSSEISSYDAIYSLRAQLRIATLFNTVDERSKISSIQLFLTSPFNMVETTPKLSIGIERATIYCSTFKKKGSAKSATLYKGRSSNYRSIPEDLFTANMVFTHTEEEFYIKLGFVPVSKRTFWDPSLFSEIKTNAYTSYFIQGGTPGIRIISPINVKLGAPGDFEVKQTQSAILMIEKKLDIDFLNESKEILGQDIALIMNDHLLSTTLPPTEQLHFEPNGSLMTQDSEYYYADSSFGIIDNSSIKCMTLEKSSDLRALAQKLTTKVLIFCATLSIASIIIFYLSINKLISVPLQHLKEGVKIISEGNLNYKMNIRSHDEFGIIGKLFNEMAQNLYRNKSELMMAVSELKEAKSYSSDLIDSLASAIIGIDRDFYIAQWSTYAETLSNVPEDKAIGKHITGILPFLKEHVYEISESIKNKESFKKERIPITGAELIYVDLMCYPLSQNEGAVIRIDNVTERVRIHEIMVQTEKMMSVGGLAAGMAHEINNPLGGIMQGAQNIARRLSPDMKKNIDTAKSLNLDLTALHIYLEKRGITRFLEGIRDSGERASAIVKNMLQFSRRSDSNTVDTNVIEMINNTIELAESDYDLKKQFDFKHIEIEKSFDKQCPYISCVKTEIEQVLLNLLKNAAHAMSDKEYTSEKPHILIRTTLINDYLEILVEDNGPGIPERVRQRIFEPFYTTKPVGVGTGLGLSVSYMIITQNHRGKLQIQSELGEWTRFIIHLPVSQT